jgi:hypothetical protein|tara:strand:- start:71 stop:856 length:786 start_codon:yes stop_codon:yes gene_type:complete
MLKICTVYFGDKYTPDYVGKLFRSIRRNSSIQFQSICISDDPNVEADIVLPYNRNSPVKLHWHKLKFFSPNYAYQIPGDDIIVMDIDQVITSNVDDLIGHPVEEGELITYGVWWNSDEIVEQGLALETNGGFYKFKSGSLAFVWDDFITNPEYWQTKWYKDNVVHFKYYGEQNYVNWKVVWDDRSKPTKITKTPPEWIAKYHGAKKDYFKNVKLNQKYCKSFDADYMILDDVNTKIKVVHFLGPKETIHEHNFKWIEDNWK